MLPEQVERRSGTAALDLDAATQVVRKAMPAMRACLAKLPTAVLQITISRAGPRSKPDPRPAVNRTRIRVAAPPPDNVNVGPAPDLRLDVTRAEVDAASRCVDPLASKLALPAVKETDGYYVMSFLVAPP